MKENALFISHRKFLDAGLPEGGVKFCTDEFIALINERFQVVPFAVEYSRNTTYRIKKKTGLAAYDDYEVEIYRERLQREMKSRNVAYIFLNLSATATFAKMIKSFSPSAKVILCSHGNESGDHLHDIAGHKKYGGLKKNAAVFSLGHMLVKEYDQRKYLDLVLTVSEIEENLEKWLGAKEVYMVPRTIAKREPDGIPIKGRIGFLSDLSHEPNFYGITKLCEKLAEKCPGGIELRLAGSGNERGLSLEKQYSFIKYLGHLTEEALLKETATWTFALNPVFYYSRGVSTKLGKLLGEGIPVITTDKGMRGYKWLDGTVPVCKNEEQMAKAVMENSLFEEKYLFFREEVKKIQQSSPSLAQIMADISIII